MADTDSPGVPVLRLTDPVLARILELRAAEEDAASLGLWVEVSGTSGGAYTYDMYFQGSADAGSRDWTEQRDDLTVVVPASSIDRMRGAILDLVDDGSDGAGMVIKNPNQPPASPASAAVGHLGPPPDLTGDVAQRVLQVLEQQINPAIAAHGGRADLVAIEDDTAYVRMSGGCAGCGLASVTLTQGIEVAIVEAIPELAHVVDVTDHAAGTNPYYEPAKK